MGKLIYYILFILFVPLVSFGQSPNEIAQVFILRHAEKADNSKDPELSVAGLARAQRLDKLLADVRIDKLYATPYKRTNQTLAALAERQQLAIAEAPNDLAIFAQQILATKSKTIVIAAHSNTAPQLVNLLIADKKYSQIDDDEYGKIWYLTLQNGKALSCILLNTN